MSERVEREFKELKERYEIPDIMDFHLKTFLNLREEYDNIVPAGDNTKRREALLDMIGKVQREIRFVEKEKYKMYVNVSWLSEKYYVSVYLRNQIIVIQDKECSVVGDSIMMLAENNRYQIHIDCNGIGKAVADYIEGTGKKINKLDISKFNINKREA